MGFCFGVSRRHRGPPFAPDYHQFMKLVAIQNEGEGESSSTSVGSVFYLYFESQL